MAHHAIRPHKKTLVCGNNGIYGIPMSTVCDKRETSWHCLMAGGLCRATVSAMRGR